MNSGLFSNKNILITFDMIYNIDLGVLYTMKEKFGSSKFIDLSVFNNEENRIIYHLLNRENENPLSLIIKQEYLDQIDTLLSDVYTEFYSEILEKVKPTNLIDIIIVTSSINHLNLIVYCKNKLEEQYIRQKLSLVKRDLKTIVKEDISEIEFSQFDAIIIDKSSQLKKIVKNILGKTVYLCKARYNLVRNETGFSIPLEITDLISDELIFLMEPYVVDQSFFISG